MLAEKSEYSYEEIFAEEKIKHLGEHTVLGIDIGSRQGKAVLFHQGNIYCDIEPTGLSMQITADRLKTHLLLRAGLEETDLEYLIGTGYGRVSMQFDHVENNMLTEISCHGMGAAYLYEGTKTVLDIGGQDSKIIKVNDKTGQVLDFAMNDKCAAGTGRFLERAAEILGYEVTQIGDISLKADQIHEISSQCVVFAESEIVSARATGIDPKNILAGVHASVIGRVKGLFKRIGIEKEVMFTGGVSNNVGMKKALEDMLGFPIAKPVLNPVYAGALGAAVYASKHCEKQRILKKKKSSTTKSGIDLTKLNRAVEEAKQDYIQHKDNKKNVAYLCAYTPLEILEAANVRHIRLLHTGSEREIAAGEEVVSKIACDYSKSFVGSFAEGNPINRAIDKVYSFYTCSFMTSAINVIGARYVSAGLFAVPKQLNDSRSKQNYISELENFIIDLEELTGSSISKEEIAKNIKKYNKARRLLREISAYRKERVPLLSSLEYQKIALSYYYLPLDRLLTELADIKEQLEQKKGMAGNEPLRLMITGGILTEEDSKVVKILEEDFGARVVVEDNCSGYTPFVMELPEDIDVLESIAEGYLGKAPCANQKPLKKRVDAAVQLAKEYQVDGVIYYFMQFCPTHGMAKKNVVDALAEMNFPSLDIAGNYSSGDEGQIKTRLEAFIEMLEKKRGEVND